MFICRRVFLVLLWTDCLSEDTLFVSSGCWPQPLPAVAGDILQMISRFFKLLGLTLWPSTGSVLENASRALGKSVSAAGGHAPGTPLRTSCQSLASLLTSVHRLWAVLSVGTGSPTGMALLLFLPRFWKCHLVTQEH